MACTVLLPVSVSGQGIGDSPNFCAVLGPRAIGVGDCDGDNDREADQMCRNDVGTNYRFAANIDV